MSEINLGGRPCEYNADDHAAIVEAFKHTIVLSNVAGQVRRTKDTIRSWMKRGENDIKEGKDTEIARFFVDVKQALSGTIRNLEQKLLYGDDKSWQRFAWYLERCAREDYGADAGIIEEILEEFKKMKEAQEARDGAR